MSAIAVIQKLLASAEVTALVGSRIEPNIIKQDTTYPAIYVSADQMDALGCYNSNGVEMGTIEVGIYAPNYLNLIAIKSAVRKALDNFAGNVAGFAIDLGRGKEGPDQYDDEQKQNVKVIEYPNAISQPISTP